MVVCQTPQAGRHPGLQLCGQRDLALEPFYGHLSRHLGGQDLDNDLPAERALCGDKDAGHAAAAELALDGVGVTHGLLEFVAEVQVEIVQVPERTDDRARLKVGRAGEIGQTPCHLLEAAAMRNRPRFRDRGS